MATVRVFVDLKPSLLDSAGRTVAQSLHGLGYEDVHSVRIGKVVTLDVDDPTPEKIKSMCERLLANPVIEDFRYEVVAP